MKLIDDCLYEVYGKVRRKVKGFFWWGGINERKEGKENSVVGLGVEQELCKRFRHRWRGARGRFEKDRWGNCRSMTGKKTLEILTFDYLHFRKYFFMMISSQWPPWLYTYLFQDGSDFGFRAVKFKCVLMFLFLSSAFLLAAHARSFTVQIRFPLDLECS